MSELAQSFGDSTEPMVVLDGVSKVFGNGPKAVVAVDNVSLTINRGEIFAIIGYSGAGKSTLVRLINGLETTTSGTLTVGGFEISGKRDSELREARTNIGMIFQQFNLMNSRTVLGNVEFPLKIAGWSKKDRRARALEMLEFVGLADRADHYPNQLSGGQKQRVGIARALATNPALLLADESTSALDPETTHEVLALLKKVNRELGVTVVVITHEMDVVSAIADRVAVMESGRVVEQGNVYDVFSNPQTDVAKLFVATTVKLAPPARKRLSCAQTTRVTSSTLKSWRVTRSSVRCCPTWAPVTSASTLWAAVLRPCRVRRTVPSPWNSSAKSPALMPPLPN